MSGPIALVGGAEWHPPARALDEWLIDRSGTKTVTILPTAAAKERPEKAVEFARRYFESLGAQVEGAMILDRVDAEDKRKIEQLASSTFTYIAGGDPRHLARVLRDTSAWRAIHDANAQGGVLAGSSAGAMVMCDRMIWPSAPEGEDGLGTFKDLVIIPHHDKWKAKVRPLVDAMKEDDVRLVGVDECTAIVVDSEHCRILGAGSVTMYQHGSELWSTPAPAEMEGECF